MNKEEFKKRAEKFLSAQIPPPPTEKQLRFIHKIEVDRGCIFTGKTRKEANEFISEYMENALYRGGYYFDEFDFEECPDGFVEYLWWGGS